MVLFGWREARYSGLPLVAYSRVAVLCTLIGLFASDVCAQQVRVRTGGGLATHFVLKQSGDPNIPQEHRITQTYPSLASFYGNVNGRVDADIALTFASERRAGEVALGVTYAQQLLSIKSDLLAMAAVLGEHLTIRRVGGYIEWSTPIGQAVSLAATAGAGYGWTSGRTSFGEGVTGTFHYAPSLSGQAGLGLRRSLFGASGLTLEGRLLVEYSIAHREGATLRAESGASLPMRSTGDRDLHDPSLVFGLLLGYTLPF